MKKRNVQYCTDMKMCTSCGFCYDICPVNAIAIIKKNALFVPHVDKNKCVHCGLCFDLCAGKGSDLFNLMKTFTNDNNSESFYKDDIGYYNSSFLSHSNIYNTRFHSASGGTVSQLLISLLEQGMINAAIVTRFKYDFPLEVETIIATTKEEILSARSSKYCPVHMDGILKKMHTFEGKVAFVGLPCQIQTLRNIENKYIWLREKVLLHIGLYCSGTKDSNALNYLLKSNGFDKKGIIKFAYRDDGCLGYVKADYKSSSKSVPFVEAYKKLHSFFKPERCVQCIDHFAYLADISIGDIDCEPYNKDTIGTNSLIVRTDFALKILKEAAVSNAIFIQEINVDEIVRSQRVLDYRKKLFSSFRLFNRMFFKKNVKYDYIPYKKITIKGIFWTLSYLYQRLFRKILYNTLKNEN